MSFIYQIRRDTAANWSAANPTLLEGEWALETDTKLTKLGDGVTAWNALEYFTALDSKPDLFVAATTPGSLGNGDFWLDTSATI